MKKLAISLCALLLALPATAAPKRNDKVYAAVQANRDNFLALLRDIVNIDSGTGYWNCCDRVSAAVPWSGRKHSGFGSTLSHAGLRAFTKPKAYHLRRP